MRYAWYFFQNVYSSEECDEIYHHIKNNTSKDWSDRPANVGKRVNVSLIENSAIEEKLKKYFQYVEQVNEENFGFKIFGRPRTSNLNEYSGDMNEYPYHRDSSEDGSMADIKFTSILNLSTKPYTGGELTLFLGNEMLIDKFNTPGSLIIFPSFYYHKVSKVTSGERCTFSSWWSGPNWK